MKRITKSLAVVLLCLLGIVNAIAVEDKSVAKGISLFEAGEITQARDFFKQLVAQQPNNAQGQFYLGRVSYHNEKYEAAESYFDKSVELSPKNSLYYVWQGRNYIKRVNEVGFFSKMSMGKSAKAAFEKAVALDPNHIDGLSGLARYYLGAPSIAGGDPDKAAELAQKIIALGDVGGEVLLLQVNLNRNEKSVSIEDFESVAKKVGDNPKYSGFYNVYGYHLMGLDKTEAAINQFTKQVELNPTSANAFDSLGEGYYEAKRYKLAADAFKKALLIDPSFSHAKKYLKKAQKKIKRQNR
jgi:tetratricopeptide (TPR) repeat protein